MWNLILRCFAPRRPHRGPAPADDVLLPEADERPLGCGWFDSSHELAHGAKVIELDDAAAPLWQWAARAQA
jgi:hypothetical protein